ncbi:DNA annealing helicase and endonuclease ZRANB3-like [Asterias rubens]|uniref:DNA annealing helicase and endonuclease ZRANB3-like n=1 Tax=Asterias rubens TaxID=7604 RepID=UPI0014550C7F|nr:DNA annealing helicase and endonuclease ZRANB3-like [Asterias rubens]
MTAEVKEFDPSKDAVLLESLPKGLCDKLLPFQKEGILYALQRNGRCLFGDEMGLGKTIQAISVAYCYKSDWPLLIVVPSSMRYPWIEELEKWLPELQPNDINLITSGTDIRNIPSAKISIIGYGLLRIASKTLVGALTEQKFQVVIVDESHYLKNRQAARTKLLVPLLHTAKRVILLTGTPALARPAELFTQIDSVQKGIMGSWSQFAKRYCDAQWKNFGKQRRWDTTGATNLSELHTQLVQKVMIRREKKDVLKQLPPKRRQKVPFELADSAEKKELEDCWVQLENVFNPKGDMEELNSSGFEVKRLASQMYTLTGKAKIGAVCEYIKMLLQNDNMKFLVFAHHKEVLTALAQTVAAYTKEHQKQLKYIRIDGDVPSSERMHLVNQFQTDCNTRVALLSILAAGTGLTLTAASQVVFAELHWTPGILHQCEDRAHRIGQLNAIHVHYLVAKGTIDEWMWSALSKKVNVLSSTLNGRLQHLRMDEKEKEEVEFLKHAAAWLPSNRDLDEDDAFYFSQKENCKSRDIRSFFTAKGQSSKKRKRKNTPAETPCSPHGERRFKEEIQSTSVIVDEDEDDFKAIKKHRPSKDVLHKRSIIGRDGKDSSPDVSIKSCPDTVSLPEDCRPGVSGEDCLTPSFDYLDDLPVMRSNKRPRRGVTFDDQRDKDSGCTKIKTAGSPKVIKLVKYSSSFGQQDNDLMTDSDQSYISTNSSTNRNRNQSPLNICTQERGKDRKSYSVISVSLSSAFVNEDADEDAGLLDEFPWLEEASHAADEASQAADEASRRADEASIGADEAFWAVDEGFPGPDEASRAADEGFPGPDEASRAADEGFPGPDEASRAADEGFPGPDEASRAADEGFPGPDEASRAADEGFPGPDEASRAADEGFPGPDEASGVADDATRSWRTWGCNACTFSNHIDLPFCEICSTPRKTKRSRLSGQASQGTNKSSTCQNNDSKTKNNSTFAAQRLQTCEPDQIKSPKTPNRMTKTTEQPKLTSTVNATNNEDQQVNVTDNDSVLAKEIEDATCSYLANLTAPENALEEPWRCNQASCGYVNTNNDSECETCWSPKPTQPSDKCSPPAIKRAKHWICADANCGHFNTNDNGECEACWSPKPKSPRVSFTAFNDASQSDESKYVNDPPDDLEDVKPTTSSLSLMDSEVEDPVLYDSFLYCLSKHTDRIYLYDQDERPLNCSFLPIDLQHHDLDALPSVLHYQHNLRVALRFLREWNSLNEIKKKQLRKSGAVMENPLAALESLKQAQHYQPCTKRSLTKIDLAIAAKQKADLVGGSVRVITKHRHTSKGRPAPHCSDQSSSSDGASSNSVAEQSDKNISALKRGTCVQALDDEGRPLCVFCGKVTSTSTALEKHQGAAWDMRYCSETCKHEFNCRRSNSKYIRDQLLEAEHGVCQLCGVKAQELCNNIKDAAKSERKILLEESVMSKLSTSRLNEIIRNPSSGQFWHADHIVAVFEGGGLCSLDNFRTLCVVCHDKVTAEQNMRRRKRQRTAGIFDIRSFFKP